MPQRFDELCRIFPPESEGKQCRSAVSQGHSVRDVFTTLEQKGLHHKSRKKRELRSQTYAARRRSNIYISSIIYITSGSLTILCVCLSNQIRSKSILVFLRWIGLYPSHFQCQVFVPTHVYVGTIISFFINIIFIHLFCSSMHQGNLVFVYHHFI